MYRSFYNLTEKPFQITTDPRFLWLGEKHQEAFATLKYGILDDRGFLLLTGDVGTGKTTLINALAKSLDTHVILARITDPKLEEMDFYRFIAHEFAIKRPFHSKGEFLLIFREFLEKAHDNGKQVLLIADEAQRLSPGLLEDIRHLSNIEKEHVKLLNIFFVGQVEFNNVLLDKRNKAIRQRITVHYTLEPLTEVETAEYIRHRLQVAGGSADIFSAEALRAVYAFAKGAPRLINIICDRALLTGFVEGRKKIEADIIAECAAELAITPHDDEPAGEEAPGPAAAPAAPAATANSGAAPAPARPAEIRSELEHIQPEPVGAKKKEDGMRSMLFVYFTIALVLGALVACYFYLPWLEAVMK
jgi:general secretion pathway protein A